MNCCQNQHSHQHSASSDSQHNFNGEEKQGISWKTILIVVIILGLLFFSLLSIMYH